MRFLFAQITGILCSILSISLTQFKERKHILIGEVALNILFGINYFLLMGYTGTLVCIIAMIHTVIVYKYSIKDAKIPLYINISAIVCYIIVTLLCAKVIKDYFPFISAILFTFAINQKDTFKYRLLKASNTSIWLIYDICVRSYGSLFAKVLNLISHAVAIKRYNLPNQSKE